MEGFFGGEEGEGQGEDAFDVGEVVGGVVFVHVGFYVGGYGAYEGLGVG